MNIGFPALDHDHKRCVAEVTSGALGRDLSQAARGVGFSARGRVLEVSGLCNACKKAEARA
jgi:Fe2+ or Zn2+ uptake regulation protein